jgi:hypothetical protein
MILREGFCAGSCTGRASLQPSRHPSAASQASPMARTSRPMAPPSALGLVATSSWRCLAGSPSRRLRHPPTFHQHPPTRRDRRRGCSLSQGPAEVDSVRKSGAQRLRFRPVLRGDLPGGHLAHPAMKLLHDLAEEAAGPGGVSQSSSTFAERRFVQG